MKSRTVSDGDSQHKLVTVAEGMGMVSRLPYHTDWFVKFFLPDLEKSSWLDLMRNAWHETYALGSV